MIVARLARYYFRLRTVHVIIKVSFSKIKHGMALTACIGLLGLLIAFCTFSVFVCVTVAYLHYLNRKNEQRRIMAGKGRQFVQCEFMAEI